MTSRIIAICGLKRSGKDTIADFLCQHYGYEKIKIAAPLKNGLKAMFGFTDEQIEGDDKDVVDPRWGVEPRKVMQFFGTEVMQYQVQTLLPNIGRTFWIQSLVQQYIQPHPSKLYVIPDLRFHHEYDILAEYGVEFWRVERTTNKNKSCEHVSEQEYLSIPVSKVYLNDTKEKLYNDIITELNRT
jgi:hypothetical protein